MPTGKTADGYGGSLLLIRKDIVSEPVDITTNCDIIFRKIECSNSQTLVIGSAYRPTNNDAEYVEELVDVIRKVCHKYKDAVIWIAGDLNLPDIDWTTSTIAGHQYRKQINEVFLSLERDLGLNQVIDKPTREENILDLFFTNRPSLVNRSTVIPRISDHHAIFIDSHITMSRQKPIKRTNFMWGKANVQGMKEMSKQLSSSIIDHFSSSSNINDVWEFFKEGCQKIIEDKVLTRTTSKRFTQPWINRDIRRITRLKRRWFRRATRSKQPQDWNRYKALKKQAEKACRDTHDEFVNTMLTNDSANPKRF